MIVVHAGGIASNEGISGPRSIVIQDGVIAAINEGQVAVERRDSVIDAMDAVVGAGLIDAHTHGIAGAQAIDGTSGSIAKMAEAYARHGVTGFLATIGGSTATIEAGISGVVAYLAESAGRPAGARCFGIHLEGPFISPARPGAFVPDTIIAPDSALLREFAEQAGGSIRRLTLAPELPGMDEILPLARQLGIRPSAGHSEATAADMDVAIAAGVDSVTHTFNAMPQLHHREPGLVGTALTDKRVIAEVVPDGVHVGPTVMDLLARSRGWQGVALVTDSIAAAGLPDGVYYLEEQRITVRGAEARLSDGTLAGSTLTLDEGIRRFSAATGLPWHQAHASASLVPSRLMGLAGRKGRIAVGYDADLAAFDAVRQVVWTMVGGVVVYRA